jgi:hypothetical protein
MKTGAMKGGGRTAWLGAALLVTLLAAQWVSGEDVSEDRGQNVHEEKSRPNPGARTIQNQPREEQPEAGRLDIERFKRLESRKFNAQAGDIFSRKSWVPPPSPDAKPPPPSAPPLPFKYIGKVTEGDETQVFLSLAERNYIVKPGENIDGQYRVDEVSDHAVTLTYLPLNAKQTLIIAGLGEVR